MPAVLYKILSVCKGGGYRFCRTDPPHPKRNAKGLYPLHRVLAENRLGRSLEPNETVHHGDEDKGNDAPGNLEVLTRSEHARLHAISRETAPVALACPSCGTPFSLKPHVLRLRQSRNRDGKVFCSRSCGTSFWNGPPPAG